MFPGVLWLPKSIWLTGFALIAMGCGIGSPFGLLAFGAEPIPLPEISQSFSENNFDQPYIYTVGNRRDPFIPLRNSHASEDSTAAGLPELIHAEQGVRVLGIISGERGYQAILKLPNGERVIVGPGSLLENISLTVKRITNDSVVITKPLEGTGDSGILDTTLSLSP